MELSTYVLICFLTSCHLCQLLTDIPRCRTYISFLAFVCLFVACLFSAFDIKYLTLFEFSKIFQIFKEKDISYKKPRTDTHTHTHTHKSMYWVAEQLNIWIYPLNTHILEQLHKCILHTHKKNYLWIITYWFTWHIHIIV